MSEDFEPIGHNSVPPYFVLDDRQEPIDPLATVFDAKKARRYDDSDGVVMHAGYTLDANIVMWGRASDLVPGAQDPRVHVYVQAVDTSYQPTLDHGCKGLEEPEERQGDVDRRRTFQDVMGYGRSIGTQK